LRNVADQERPRSASDLVLFNMLSRFFSHSFNPEKLWKTP
jgi:hypothetical protein